MNAHENCVRVILALDGTCVESILVPIWAP